MVVALNLILVISFVWVPGPGLAEENRAVCPKYCHCDLYENLNRADCSDKKIISTSIDIPATVEILDLSYNDISTLEDRCFKELIYLLNLTITNNAIHTIFLDAFYELVNLQHVDLSFNRLEYFDPRIFENNLKLVGVNLNGNKFMSLSSEPFIISPSIQYLSLHMSQIMQTSEQHFVKMPLLTKLDLSDNLLITLNVATFMRLSHLKYLNLLNNRWTTCHAELKSTLEYLRARQVEVRTNVCNTKFGEKKFERMMMGPSESSGIDATTEHPTEKDMSSIWKNTTMLNGTTNIECESENLEAICSLYESCTLMYNKLVADQISNQYRLNFFDHNQRVYVALYSGLFLGFFVTSSVIYVFYLIYGSRYWRKRRLQRKLAERRRAQGLSTSSSGHSVATAIPARVSRIPRRAPPTLTLNQPRPTRQAISRAYQREFLLARLFERPERRRYNQHHHQSSIYIERARAANPQNLETEQLIQPSPSDENNTSPIAAASQDNANVAIEVETSQREDQHIEEAISNMAMITVITPIQEEPIMDPLRPETPPPPYSEIIKD